MCHMGSEVMETQELPKICNDLRIGNGDIDHVVRMVGNTSTLKVFHAVPTSGSSWKGAFLHLF